MEKAIKNIGHSELLYLMCDALNFDKMKVYDLTFIFGILKPKVIF